MTDPVVSIIIVNWNRKEDLLFTLANVSKDKYPFKEVIIVDNGSTDGSASDVPEKFPSFTYVNLASNVGCEEGYNVGVLHSNGEYVVFLDSDAYIEEGGIQKIVQLFLSDTSIGIIDPLILNYHTQLPQNSPSNWPIKGTMFTGCAVALRRVLLDEIGLRPANFFIYASEADVSIRALSAGYNIEHAEHIIAYHKESPVQRLSSKFFFYSTRNIIWLICKYYPIIPALRELLFHLIWNLILSLKTGNFVQYLKGVYTGFIGIPKVIKEERKLLVNWRRGRVYPPLVTLINIAINKIK